MWEERDRVWLEEAAERKRREEAEEDERRKILEELKKKEVCGSFNFSSFFFPFFLSEFLKEWEKLDNQGTRGNYEVIRGSFGIIGLFLKSNSSVLPFWKNLYFERFA